MELITVKIEKPKPRPPTAQGSAQGVVSKNINIGGTSVSVNAGASLIPRTSPPSLGATARLVLRTLTRS
jgi:hypothetical protein